jgi:hypothetical protein
MSKASEYADHCNNDAFKYKDGDGETIAKITTDGDLLLHTDMSHYLVPTAALKLAAWINYMFNEPTVDPTAANPNDVFNPIQSTWTSVKTEGAP